MNRSRITLLIALAMAVYCIYSGGFGFIDPQRHLAVYLGFSFMLVFLIHPLSRARGGFGSRLAWGIDFLLILLGAAAGLYIIVNFDSLTFRAGLPTRTDIIMGAMATALVIEMTRRTTGNILPFLAIFALIYALWGQYFPQPFTHAGVSVSRLFNFMYLTFSAIFAIPLSATADYITLFILWGAILEEAGATSLFINLANWLTGRSRGGPAKTAVIASCLMGTISGSGTANVVATGAFTIPLMKKLGYQPYFAGAVEAAASSGGQIMPPVMGAAAFLIAEALNIPYIKVALFALLPALLYFASIFISVDLRAARLGLKPLSREDTTIQRRLVLKYAHFFLSPVVLIYFLAVAMVSLQRGAFWAIVAVILLSFARRETWMTPGKLASALQRGISATLPVAAACACAGIILGVVNMTGLGLRLSGILVEIGGGSLLITLVLTMITSLILGMGLPTTACYIILAIIASPALIQMGVKPLAAHMFIFYFGTMSTLTPPVALAAYAGAGIAGAPQFKTGMTSVRLALPAFIVPYLFVYSPAVLMQGTWQAIVYDVFRCLLAFHALACAFEGLFLAPLNLVFRGLLMGAGIFLIVPGMVLDLIGFTVVFSVYLVNFLASRRVSRLAVGALAAGEGGETR